MPLLKINKKKIIIICPPKCGGTSLSKYIEKNKNSVIEYINSYNEYIELQKTYKIIVIIRNPIDRIISGYINKFVSYYTLKDIDIKMLDYNDNTKFKNLKNGNYYIENNNIYSELWNIKKEKYIYPSFNDFIDILYKFYKNDIKVDNHYNSIYNILKNDKINIKNVTFLKLKNLNIFLKDDLDIELPIENNTCFCDKVIHNNIYLLRGDIIYNLYGDNIPKYKYFLNEDIIKKIKEIYSEDISIYNNL